MTTSDYTDIIQKDESLRPYQRKAKEEIFSAWNVIDNVMFQMPTGTGKTRLFTSIISDINKYSILTRQGVKVLIIAHRTELIDQIDESLQKYHIPHNIIAGGHERNLKFPVNVASIQTISHPCNKKLAEKLNFDFIIIDEAHHALATTYKRLWTLYPNSKKLGVTATPWRMNHCGFLDLFDKLILSLSIKEFILQGYLSTYKYYSIKQDSRIQHAIDNIRLDKFGEYAESSMEEEMDIGSIRAQLLKSYHDFAEGKKGIVYAININHAKHICEEYENAGYNVVSIDSKTSKDERKEKVKKFVRGEIDIIVNVDIFSEGFDCPDIEFIQLARPTKSLVKYLQQVGRGLRIAEGKESCVILDNVGMYSRFGLPDAKRFWKHHFEGHEISETPKMLFSSGGNGKGRNVDTSEGDEEMILIQSNRIEETVEPDIIILKGNTETNRNQPLDSIVDHNYGYTTSYDEETKSYSVTQDYTPYLDLFEYQENGIDIDKIRNEFVREIENRGYGKIDPSEVFPVGGAFYDFEIMCGDVTIYRYVTNDNASRIDKELVAQADKDSDFCKAVRTRRLRSIVYVGMWSMVGNYRIQTIVETANSDEVVFAYYDGEGMYLGDDPHDVLSISDSFDEPSYGQSFASYSWKYERENYPVISTFIHNSSEYLIQSINPKGSYIEVNGEVYDVYRNMFNNIVFEKVFYQNGLTRRNVVACIPRTSKFATHYKEYKDKICHIANYEGLNIAIGVRMEDNMPIKYFSKFGELMHFYSSMTYFAEEEIVNNGIVNTSIGNQQYYLEPIEKWKIKKKKQQLLLTGIVNDNIIGSIYIKKSNPIYKKVLDMEGKLINVEQYKNNMVLSFADNNKIIQLSYDIDEKPAVVQKTAVQVNTNITEPIEKRKRKRFKVPH